ncbi:hypothetical protein IJ765_01915 [Candidatus Saccharibacteria bacterium]|nr:hypothetical protein [Candidatus Saccharibacteria bacterium]
MYKLTDQERQSLLEGLKEYKAGVPGYTVDKVDAELKDIIRVAKLKQLQKTRGGIHAEKVCRPYLTTS